MVITLKIPILIPALLYFLCTFVYSYAQAEYPRIVKIYLKINDNAKVIKESKIKKSVEVISLDNRQDTIRITEYDTDGYIIREFSKTDTSSERPGDYVTLKYSYIYNEFKQLTEKIDSSGDTPLKYYLKYDDLYNITEEEVYRQNKLIKDFSYEYDDLSRLIESVLKDEIKDCKITETYVYNSYNNLVKLIVKDKCADSGTKNLEIKYNYTYDESYRILGKSIFTPLGDNITETFTYTAEGKPETSYEMIRPDHYINRKYTYDKNTLRIEKIEVKEELSTSSDVVIKYDKFGNRLTEEYFDPKGKLLYTYKFIYNYY